MQLMAAGHRRVLLHIEGITLRRALGTWADIEGMAVIFGRDVMRQIGAEMGATLHYQIERDPQPDVWDLPEELAAWLEQDEQAAKIWEGLTPGYQRSLCYYITSAKRAETRFTRAEQLVHKMKTGQLYGQRSRVGK